MKGISPYLWFDSEAERAAELYVSLFSDSRVLGVSRYRENTPGPPGSVMTVSFELAGQGFTALNGGPVFSFTPAVSFFVSCDSKEEVTRLWSKLSEGGTVHMELSEYPFSEAFGWTSDRFGVSWQLNLGTRRQKIAPFLMFVGDRCGRGEEAMESYVKHFPGSSIERLERFGAGESGREGTVKHGVCSLAGYDLMVMDSSIDHSFAVTPAISLFVSCETQDEVDALWEGLSTGGEKGQCGWLTDRYGVSWQIVPTALMELLGESDPARVDRVMQAMLKMTKLEISGLRRAYDG